MVYYCNDSISLFTKQNRYVFHFRGKDIMSNLFVWDGGSVCNCHGGKPFVVFVSMTIV